MNRFCFCGILVITGALMSVGKAVAQQAPAEPLGPPRVLESPRVEILPGPAVYYSYPRISRYAVWQNYGVDRYGKFRPLVVYSPYGSYYRYNHEPFPWTQMYPGEFMPYVVDSPTGR
jgi:hypothetical protein